MTIDNYFSLNSLQLNRTHNRILLLENLFNHSFTNFSSQLVNNQQILKNEIFQNYTNLNKQIIQNYTILRKEIFKELRFLSDKHWFYNSLTFFCFGGLLFIFIIQLLGIMFILLKINTKIAANNRRFDYWLYEGNNPIIETRKKLNNKDVLGVKETGMNEKNEVLDTSTLDDNTSGVDKASIKLNIKDKIAFWQKKTKNNSSAIEETPV